MREVGNIENQFSMDWEDMTKRRATSKASAKLLSTKKNKNNYYYNK